MSRCFVGLAISTVKAEFMSVIGVIEFGVAAGLPTSFPAEDETPQRHLEADQKLT